MNMKIRHSGWVIGTVGFCLLAMVACSQQSSPAPSANKTGTSSSNSSETLTPTGPSTRLTQRSGSKMHLEGTSTAHDWRSESGLILGYLEVGPNFPLEPGQKVTPGKV